LRIVYASPPNRNLCRSYKSPLSTSPRRSLLQVLNRISSMTPAEACDRLRQGVQQRVDLFAFSHGHDPSRHEVGKAYLKGKRLATNGLPASGRFFFSPQDISSRLELLRTRLPKQVDEIVCAADQICRHRFDLLGYKEVDYGGEIDWHLDRVHNRRAPNQPFFKINFLDFSMVGDAKVTWELNRHQHFIKLAQAYRLTNNPAYATELISQWRHWQVQNPYPWGINWASSLEVAFRLLSWLWTYFLLDGTPCMTSDCRCEWLRVMALHARHIDTYLSSYFSPNTHLLGEAVALFFVGTLCPQLRSASRWRGRGRKLILQESKRQIRADGFHFEQSTYYHVYALDFFLHAKILAAINGLPFPAGFDARVENMLGALASISWNGGPPCFGDDDGGRVFDPRRNRAEHMLDPLATGTALFHRGDFKYLAGGLREETIWLLGEDGVAEFDRLVATPPECKSTLLPQAGLYLMTSRENSLQATIDAGPQGALSAGHGHADALSMTVSARGRELLIDPGTLAYVGMGTERSKFRATAAHNTVVVDSQSQSEPAGPFAWKRLIGCVTETWITAKRFDFFIGSHDGYKSSKNRITHRRFVFFRKPHFWLVRDEISGAAGATHRIEVRWHLNPQLHPSTEIANSFFFAAGAEGITILAPVGGLWAQTLEPDSYSPVYGVAEPSSTVQFSTSSQLPAEFATLLMPVFEGSSGSSGHPAMTRVSDANGTTEYRFTVENTAHRALFADGKVRAFGSWRSDGKFFYESGTSGKTDLLIVCDFTELSFRDKQVVHSPKGVSWLEVAFSTDGVVVDCSDPLPAAGLECLNELFKLSPKPIQPLAQADS
jgi:uncharacterized heparinase superfamily protein